MERKDYYDVLLSLPESSTKLEMIITEGEGAGAKALFADGKTAAWTGGGDVRAFFEASETEIYKKYKAGALEGNGDLFCGGRTLFFERLNRVPRLVICGAGHVGLALCRMASLTGLETIVIEDRPEYADLAREAGAAQVICAPFEEALTGLESDEGTCYVLVTRGHQHGMESLRVILGKPRLYAGMMSSRARAAGARETLLREGFSEEDVQAVHMPIGLSIGAATPQEIAVSILAQVISVIRAGGTGDGYSPEILDALRSLRTFAGAHGPDSSGTGTPGLDSTGSGSDAPAGRNSGSDGSESLISGRGEPGSGRPRAVLATIVKKEGEAPRNPGTRMLVLPDGSRRGTIGGGYAEEVIRRAALQMLQETGPRPQAGSQDPPPALSFLKIDMPSGGSRQASGEQGPDTYSDESMICGGRITVLLEQIR